MSDIEEQKKHYDKLVTYIEGMMKRYSEHRDHPEDNAPFGVIEKEGLGEDKAHTYYTQLRFDISELNSEANN